MERPNQRNRARIQFETSVSLKIGDKTLVTDASSRDISLDGIFIKTTEPVPLNTICEVGITITGPSSTLTLKIKGRTIRQNGSGIAVRFTEFELDSYVHLKNIVFFNQNPESPK